MLLFFRKLTIAGLWIAFNLYFYRVHWQRYWTIQFRCTSCELLSICIFIGFIDNRPFWICNWCDVVNCFQFVFLSGSLTTNNYEGPYILKLWIAFNLYFYRVHWQPSSIVSSSFGCCELLSICIFIGFIDNG